MLSKIGAERQRIAAEGWRGDLAAPVPRDPDGRLRVDGWLLGRVSVGRTCRTYVFTRTSPKGCPVYITLALSHDVQADNPRAAGFALHALRQQIRGAERAFGFPIAGERW